MKNENEVNGKSKLKIENNTNVCQNDIRNPVAQAKQNPNKKMVKKFCP